MENFNENVDGFDEIDPDRNHFYNVNENCKTYSIDSFNSNVNINCQSLNIYHNNSQSILKPGKQDEYNMLFRSLKIPFDLLVFSETWIVEDRVKLCQFSEYTPVHLIRPISTDVNFKDKGGGISIFIRNNLSFKHRDDLSIMLPYMECLFIEMQFASKKFLIGGFYRVPNTSINSFIDKFNEVIEQLKTNYELILIGDYNIDLFKDDINKTNFLLCQQSNYLMPIISEATRVCTKINNDGTTSTSKTLIDNILVKANTNYISGVIDTKISDHYSIFASIPLFSKNTIQNTQMKFRLINDYNQRKFNCQLMQYNILNILNETNSQLAFSTFYKTFTCLYNNCFNIITKNLDKKDIDKPWINDFLLKRMKIRDKLYKLSLKNHVPRKVYTDFRNSLNKQITVAKEKYYEKEFNNNEKNVKKTWSLINNVLKPKNVKPKISISDKNTGVEIKDSDVPNHFIEYFTSIAEELTSQMPDNSPNVTKYLKNRVQSSFFFAPCTPTDISKAISDLKDNGKGLYVISNSVLESSSHIISPILSHIANLCLKDGYFPDELKLGCITPIFKKGKKDLAENYRPVCSLSPFSKIIERIVYDRMITFINKNNIFSSSQYGFRKGMSTETAIIDYINKIHSGLNNKHYSISVLMDLSKAFDLMDHSILKVKLEHYGFRGNTLNFLYEFFD